jgi:hypothetical protein
VTSYGAPVVSKVLMHRTQVANRGGCCGVPSSIGSALDSQGTLIARDSLAVVSQSLQRCTYIVEGAGTQRMMLIQRLGAYAKCPLKALKRLLMLAQRSVSPAKAVEHRCQGCIIWTERCFKKHCGPCLTVQCLDMGTH